MQSELRLFLSVDMAGSTHLKNVRNHQTIITSLNERKKYYKEFDDFLAAFGNNIDQDVLNQYKENKFVYNTALMELDWVYTLEEALNSFHNKFYRKIKPRREEFNLDTTYPWKALGDELVYSFKISSKEITHELVSIFMDVLNSEDKKYLEGEVIRLKGCGWVAGFPIRNRMVKLPFPELYRRGDNGNPIEGDIVEKDGTTKHFNDFKEYPFLKNDYLGPDMDIGFRISKNSWPNMMVASMELVELLGEVSDRQQIKVCQVGWQVLRGVWNNKPYPIFWLVAPERTVSDFEELKLGDEILSENVKGWVNGNGNLKEARDYLNEITNIRARLPKSLGLVKPYIVQEGGIIPNEHLKLLEILNIIENNKTQDEQAQGSPDTKIVDITKADKDVKNILKNMDLRNLDENQKD